MSENIRARALTALNAHHFDESTEVKVAFMQEARCSLSSYNRRDFFKVTLCLRGTSELHYSSRSYAITQPALVFTNKSVPYSWDLVEGTVEPEGFFCVFTEAFLQAGLRVENLKDSVLYRPGGNPVYFLTKEQQNFLALIFERMRQEMDGDYVHKYDLIRNHLSLLIHEAMKMQPAVDGIGEQPTAASRITKLFMDLLNAQFPVESPRHEMALKKAGDFADRLAVHVNHLNAALHQVTGKSTTALINERLMNESKALLMHTSWSVADIAYSLGFEYPSYFNIFFKKHTGITPLAFRKTL